MSTWLPPLNDHERYSVQVIAEHKELNPTPKASSSTTKTNAPPSLPHFAITARVRVRFCSSTGSDLGFHGLNYSIKNLLISCGALTYFPAKKAQNILCAALRIPFELDRVYFAKKHLGEKDYSISSSMEKNWFAKFQEFLIDMSRTRNNSNSSHNVFPLKLRIEKLVVLTDNEYSGWRDWYNFSKEVIPDFEKIYRAAIRRPRSDEEFMHLGPVLDFDQAMKAILKDVNINDVGQLTDSCSICLEDLSNYESNEEEGIKGLSCGHLFHSNCIREWFLRNQVCPLCRGNLPFSIIWVD